MYTVPFSDIDQLLAEHELKSLEPPPEDTRARAILLLVLTALVSFGLPSNFNSALLTLLFPIFLLASFHALPRPQPQPAGATGVTEAYAPGAVPRLLAWALLHVIALFPGSLFSNYTSTRQVNDLATFALYSLAMPVAAVAPALLHTLLFRAQVDKRPGQTRLTMRVCVGLSFPALYSTSFSLLYPVLQPYGTNGDPAYALFAITAFRGLIAIGSLPLVNFVHGVLASLSLPLFIPAPPVRTLSSLSLLAPQKARPRASRAPFYVGIACVAAALANGDIVALRYNIEHAEHHVSVGIIPRVFLTSTDVISSTAELAKLGADLVVFPENCLTVATAASGEDIFHATMAAALAGTGSTVLATYALLAEDGSHENRAAFIDETGLLSAPYAKRHPLTGEGATPGTAPSTPVTLLTRAGLSYSAAPLICLDSDFLDAASGWGVGAQTPNLVLVPAWEWAGMEGRRFNAACRGIEMGASVVKVTLEGISLATTPAGEIVAQLPPTVSTLAGVVGAAIIQVPLPNELEWAGMLLHPVLYAIQATAAICVLVGLVQLVSRSRRK
jgi:predicted amidohydrolase